MKQHFKVGELVVIISEGYPEDNGGPYEVIEISEAGRKGFTANGGYEFVTEEIGYMVSNGENSFYKQSCLFKHYPPSTQTFAEIMEGLKQPVTNAR